MGPPFSFEGCRLKGLVTVLLALFVLLQHRLWSGSGSIPDLWRLQAAIESQNAENAALRERNERLQAEVTDLKEGLDAIEERARRDLGMIRRDETFYQFIDE